MNWFWLLKLRQSRDRNIRRFSCHSNQVRICGFSFKSVILFNINDFIMCKYFRWIVHKDIYGVSTRIPKYKIHKLRWKLHCLANSQMYYYRNNGLSVATHFCDDNEHTTPISWNKIINPNIRTYAKLSLAGNLERYSNRMTLSIYLLWKYTMNSPGLLFSKEYTSIIDD
jgi:hypothetical protein